MRQLLTILMTVMTMLAATAQTRSLATLLHDGKLTFYDKVTSLEDAISAAVDGDTIYLSEGKFGASSDSITILNKKISIVGAGYGSDIKPIIHFLFKDYTGEDNVLKAPLFDGVKLGTLRFNNSDSILNINIKNCRINIILLSDKLNDVIIERCWVDSYNSALGLERVSLTNSKIKEFVGNHKDIVEHCNIYDIIFGANYILNSIIAHNSASSTAGASTNLYENCLFVGSWSFSGTNNISYEHNSSIQMDPEDMYCFPFSSGSSYSGNYTIFYGTDGTQVGVNGGEQPFSENPTVPTVDSSKSSVEYDKDSNKLNVTITVAPN